MPSRVTSCPKCEAEAERSVRHDAYFCAKCDQWLEPVCFGQLPNDPCIYCKERPEKPSNQIEEI